MHLLIFTELFLLFDDKKWCFARFLLLHEASKSLLKSFPNSGHLAVFGLHSVVFPTVVALFVIPFRAVIDDGVALVKIGGVYISWLFHVNTFRAPSQSVDLVQVVH